MRKLSPLLALVIAVAFGANAFAKPRVIGDLTQGALLGPIASSVQLQNEFSQRSDLIADATIRLGLTQQDYDEVRSAVRYGQTRYVEIPRHLDGMAGFHHGVTFAVHDIVIPAHVYGWEVDLNRPDSVVRVFLPNQCGNISYIRVSKTREVARTQSVVAPAPLAYFGSPAPPMPTLAPSPSPSPSITPPPPAAIAPAPPAEVHHHGNWWPLLALIAVPFLVHGGGGSITTTPGGHGTLISMPPIPIPHPTPTICPPSVVHRP